MGRRILNAEFGQLRVLRGLPLDTAAALAGQRVLAVERHGKFIAIRLERGYLVVHLGMTGKLLMDAVRTKWTHAIFTLDEGVMSFDDARQFGRIEYGAELPARVSALGPEPLEVSPEEFARRLKERHSPVKAVLLNQAVVRGVGNIYADEALFRAGVHPKRVASSLRKDRVGEALSRNAGGAGGGDRKPRVFGVELRGCGRAGRGVSRIRIGFINEPGSLV